MAIYGDNKHDSDPIKERIRNKNKFYLERAKKAKENKEKLIEELINDMFYGGSDWESYKEDLCRESLKKKTQKELKGILYGN